MSTNHMPDTFDWSTARALRDTAYASVYVIEDAQGRIARKRKSRAQTYAPARRFKSEAAAIAAIYRAREAIAKAIEGAK